MEIGKLIVVEGACDGIGKTTQFKLLCDRLEKDNYKIANHHFPSYGTYQGAPVERYLSGEFGAPKDLSPYYINSLYAVDRAITWLTKLKPLYEEGRIILLDRYATSTLIYQAALIDDMVERKKFVDYVVDFEYNKLGIKIPDDVIFLYAPFDLVTKMRMMRKLNAGVENDVHERDLDYMYKVYENAMYVADYLEWDKVRCDYNGQMRPIDDIHEEVYSKVKKIKNDN